MMREYTHCRFWFLLCTFSLLHFQSLPAQQLIAPPKIDPSSVATVKQLLFDLWQPGTTNRVQAEKLYETLRLESRDLTLSYVANRLNDGRRSDALKVLQTATERDSKFLDAWMLKSYLDILANDYSQGLMGLRSARRALDEANPAQPQRAEFYRRTGELIGYLQGPVANRVDQNLLKSTIDQLLSDTSEQDTQAFNTAATQILAQFEERSKTAQTRIDEELEKQATIDANRQVALTNQNHNLKQNEQVLRDRLNQLRDELGQQESQLTSQLSPLQSSAANLENQIRSLQWSLQLFYQDLARAQNEPVVCPFTVRAILDQIQRTEFTLFSLQSSYQSMILEFNSIQSQLLATRRNYGQQIDDHQRELKRVGVTVTRNQTQLSRIAAGPQISSGKREVEASRVNSLAHYIKLPAVLIRQELIEQLESM